MRRHDLDPLSLLFGLAFAAAGLVLLGGGAVHAGLGFPWAGPLIAIGLAVVIVIAARPRGAEGGESAGREDDAG